MSFNQNVRSQPSQSNPSGLYSDLLAIGQTLASSGPPNDSEGIVGNTYIDTATGLTYVKNSNGTWDPIYDPGTLPVNDPFIAGTVECNFVKTDEIEVDTVKGRLADGLVIDLQATGDLQVISGSGSVKLGAPLDMQGNFIINSTTLAPLVILNQVSGQDVQIITNGGEIQTAGNLNLGSHDIINGATITGSSISIESLVDDLNLTTLGSSSIRLNSANTLLLNTTTGQDINTGGNIVMNNSEIQRCSALRNLVGEMLISNGAVSEDLALSTNGGQVTSNSNLDMLNNQINNVSGVNGSSALIQNSVLNVSNTGVLSYRAYPQSIDMILSGFGGNGTDYFNLGTATIGPADLWGVCTGNNRRLAEFSIRLHSNAIFNFGGGTAVCDIGYVANNLPMTVANFVVLQSHSFNTNDDLYGISLTGYNVAIPFRASLCARMVLAGTSSTISTAELSLNIVLV